MNCTDLDIQPAAMYWGPEYIAIYNEAYILLAGNRHPELMVRTSGTTADV